MATTIANLSGFPLRRPSDGRLRIQSITRAMVPGSTPSTLSDFCLEFRFNPRFDLSSPSTAFSFIEAILATVDIQAGAEIAHRIAAFAFDHVRSRRWYFGLSVSVVLETIYVFEQRRAQEAAAGNPIPNDSAARGYYEELEDSFYDTMFRSFGSAESEDDSAGMSEREISMLKTERLTGDEDDECCSVCLEGFVREAVITPLSPCSHRFHNGCIVKWLRNNRTCPICRGRCTI